MDGNTDISPVLARIREWRGIDFTQYRDGTLRRRIGRRVVARDCADVASYASLLDADPTEHDFLFRDLTIKYTELFRDPWVFKAIEESVLPAIIRRKRAASKCLAVWSAGCATGEEAYSLAVLVRRAAEEGRCPHQVRIIGTDIDPLAIQTAVGGSYVKDFMPRQIDSIAAQYFTDGGRLVTVSSEVKKLVSFHIHDLTAGSAAAEIRKIWPGLFDLILCRNLAIYLQRPAQARIFELFYELLQPGGFLVLGTGEMVAKHMEAKLVPVNTKARIYRKTACT